MNYLVSIILVIFSGIFSGLNLSLLSLDRSELERKISLGNKEAKKIYSVRKNGNLLLCTLLFGNVAVNATLAIFLGNIATGLVAGLIATGLIVIFGEIIPQASFARYAMEIGAKTAWLVKIFIIILFPICWPIAWILDKAFGDEIPNIYSKRELIQIVKEHGGSEHSDVDYDEERIIEGALSFSDKTAEQIMTPRTIVYAVSIDSVLNHKLLNEIKSQAFARIPVYKDTIDQVVGILFIKDLINIPAHKTVKNFCNEQKFISTTRGEKLDTLLNKFIQSKVHIALVKNDYQGLEGIVTLEDVIEEIIKQEIIDETDTVPDLQKKIKK